MKFYNLKIIDKNGYYFFNHKVGALLYKTGTLSGAEFKVSNEKIDSNYNCVLNPYLMKKNKLSYDLKISLLTKVYAKLLVIISRISFYLACQVAKLPLVRLPNSIYAAQVFNTIYSSPYQRRTLCLPRTLFILATSKSFKQKGSAFIGVFLPSKKMHAWVIESGHNPDITDEIWISYQPILIISN